MDKTPSNPTASARPALRSGWGVGTIVVVVVLFGILAAALWYAAQAWISVDGPPMPASGYIFMALGVVLSLVVGVGLMGLIFYSSRHGYDEQANEELSRVSRTSGDGRD
jgi:hypothetical protein